MRLNPNTLRVQHRELFSDLAEIVTIQPGSIRDHAENLSELAEVAGQKSSQLSEKAKNRRKIDSAFSDIS